MNILTTFRIYVGMGTPFRRWGIINTLRKLKLTLWKGSIVYVGKKLKPKFNMRTFLKALFFGYVIIWIVDLLTKKK